MNKKLIAVAVAAAVAAPGAAFAGSTLYGQAHVSVGYYDDDISNNLRVSSNTSRIGVKGSEDLGGGLKALYKAEWEVGMSDTFRDFSGATRNRDQFIALRGGFGTFKLGREDTIVKVVGRKVDLFWSTQVGQNRSVARGLDGKDSRLGNTIMYASPKIAGGLTLELGYNTDVNASNNEDDVNTSGDINNDNDMVSVGATWANGPLYLGLAYESRGIDDGGSPLIDNADTIRFGVTYKIGAVKLAGFYQDATNQGFVSDLDRSIWGIGAAYTAGKNTFKAQYYAADEFDTPVGTAADTGEALFSIGWDHKMSKRTHTYVQYAQNEGDNNIGPRLGGSGHAETVVGPAGGTVSVIDFGIRHKF